MSGGRRHSGAFVIGLFLAVWSVADTRGSSNFELVVLSSRSDTVSGGSALVGLNAAAGAHWTARLNDLDVTSSFQRAQNAVRVIALLTPLREGINTLKILANGRVKAKLDLVDHPLAGPIFSGPHQQPFICQTEINGLGPPLDADCSARTVVQYYYRSTKAGLDPNASTPTYTSLDLAPGFKLYKSEGSPPSDVAQTRTSDGRTVNYIVRREIGVINRAVYDVEFLHQPGDPLPTPWKPSTPGWNGRLVYFFDGGCGAGYRQGTFVGPIGMSQQLFVGQGYAFATSTLNVFQNNCNDRLSAETASMVKEHFIKQYGSPVYTIGWGSSGGAMQLYLTAQNHPGLLDGIIPWVAFPDMVSTAQSVTDCALLDHAFDVSKLHWSTQQKTAVSGFATWRTCTQGWSDFFIADPQNFCDISTPKNLIYDRVANPQGARCDIYDNEVNVFGRNSRTGFARRPLDDVGVQYGLVPFNEGQIDAEQFIDLNEHIGGYDDDGHIVSDRTEADPDAPGIAYQHGVLLTGGGGLSQVPIIEWRPYADDMANQHDDFRSFVTRARLVAANGNADNQVILVYPRFSFEDYSLISKTQRYDAPFSDRATELVGQMDRWLDRIAHDDAAGSLAVKVVRNKPPDLTDSCWATDGERIAEQAVYDGRGRCNHLYPPHGDPRIVAGGPLSDDIMKCRLRPISAADYAHSLSADQLRRLHAVFPTGVCDYSKPGVGR